MRQEHLCFPVHPRLGGPEAAIAAMLGLAQLRDPYTADHEERTAVLAAAVARKIGRCDAEIRAIYLASLVHDVGKAAIPIEVLNKPGPLSASEQQLVRTHVEVGYRMIARIEAPALFLETVLHHHERLDGSGYPQGLCVGDISIGAKILAVADVAEAMAAPRPYRPSLGLDAAIAELAAGKDRVYDRAAAEACIALLSGQRRSGAVAHH